jgi:hypothetical protein
MEIRRFVPRDAARGVKKVVLRAYGEVIKSPDPKHRLSFFEGLVISPIPEYQRGLLQEVVHEIRESRANRAYAKRLEKLYEVQRKETERLVAENPNGKGPIVNFPHNRQD